MTSCFPFTQQQQPANKSQEENDEIQATLFSPSMLLMWLENLLFSCVVLLRISQVEYLFKFSHPQKCLLFRFFFFFFCCFTMWRPTSRHGSVSVDFLFSFLINKHCVVSDDAEENSLCVYVRFISLPIQKLISLLRLVGAKRFVCVDTVEIFHSRSWTTKHQQQQRRVKKTNNKTLSLILKQFETNFQFIPFLFFVSLTLHVSAASFGEWKPRELRWWRNIFHSLRSLMLNGGELVGSGGYFCVGCVYSYIVRAGALEQRQQWRLEVDSFFRVDMWITSEIGWFGWSKDSSWISAVQNDKISPKTRFIIHSQL